MKLWQKYHPETPRIAFNLQEGRNIGEIQFIVQETTAAAVRSTWCALQRLFAQSKTLTLVYIFLS